MRLKDRIAIVTGAARGIGLAIAGRFRAEGAVVVISDVADDAGEAAARGIGATYLRCDVSQSAEVKALAAAVAERFGAIDILVNNAGIALAGDFLEVSEADFDRVLAVNLKGSFLMLQACARHMVAQAKAGRRPGAVVNMSSVNDTLAIPGIVTYCMSKGGVSQLTRATSIVLAPHGIRVNAIHPGGLLNNQPEAFVRNYSANTLLGRLANETDLKGAIVFLASDASAYLTGTNIPVDGGYTAK